MPTVNTRARILAKLTEERDALLSEVAALAPAGWSRSSGAEDWSPRQQLLHLIAVEPQYSGAATAAAAEPGSKLDGVDQGTPTYQDAESSTSERILEELKRVRRDSLAALEAITDEQFELRAYHGSFGDMSVAQLFRAIYRHDRMHVEQVAGRTVSFDPRIVDRPGGNS